MTGDFLDDDMRQQMRERMKRAAQRHAELEALDDGVTTCDKCSKTIHAYEAISNGGWCDACAWGWDDE